MKIILIGGDHVWSIERIYLKHLKALGLDVDLFPAQNFFFDYLKKSILNKIKYRLNISTILKEINYKLIDKLQAYDPDVIVVYKGMEVLFETLKYAKEKGIHLVNYNADNPFIFTGRGSGNKNVVRNMPLYDLHFSYNLEVIKKIKKDFHTSTYFLPFGFELDNELFNEINGQSKINRLCFLGNPDVQRVSFIRRLVDLGISIDLYGNYWSKYFEKNVRVRVFGPIYQKDFWRIMNQYDLQLNIMRIHNLDSHNMRTFEIPAAGAIQLAPETTEHLLFFDDRKEIFLYKSVEDCAQKVKQILALNPSEIENIRMNSRRKCENAKFSYFDRANEMIEEIKRVFG